MAVTEYSEYAIWCRKCGAPEKYHSVAQCAEPELIVVRPAAQTLLRKVQPSMDPNTVIEVRRALIGASIANGDATDNPKAAVALKEGEEKRQAQTRKLSLFVHRIKKRIGRVLNGRK